MIRKRGNSYEVRVYNPAVKKKVSVGSRKSLSAARSLEREKETQFSRGTVTELTVAAWAERWLELYPRDVSTSSNYRYQLRRFLEDFGDTRMRDIDRLAARTWAVANQWRVIAVRSMFNDAINSGVLYENPFARLGLAMSRGRRDLVVLSDEELQALLGAAREAHPGPYGDHFAALVLFAACTAIRPGELFALDWEHLRLDDHEADIQWQITQKHGRQRPKRGKTRTVVVPPPAASALRSMPRFSDSTNVFASTSGKRLNATSHYSLWDAVRQAAGRDGMDFYELRHYGATKLLEMGVSTTDVAAQMGHADDTLVKSTYGHPDEQAKRDRIKQAWVANGWQDPEEPARLRAV